MMMMIYVQILSLKNKKEMNWVKKKGLKKIENQQEIQGKGKKFI